MSEQEKWRRQLAAYCFAAWELHIFLDTHPNNCDAAKKLEEVRKKHKALMEKYEDKYGPIHETNQNTSRWAWVSDPWPWEQEANN